MDVYLWAPSANKVKLLVYDKDDQDKLLDTIELLKDKKGVWKKTIYAKGAIKNFNKKEDTIIYEVHVRDFTSDKNLKLKAPFGTFKAFIEKLDYIKSLGITHIQLLPILSYYNIDESRRNETSYNYLGKSPNYNWGYDPQSYFALSGMYSTDPSDATKVIAEFKELVYEIHKRGMGVILDVVYNYSAKLNIFEDIEPEYYHFMDAENRTLRESLQGIDSCI